MGTTEANPATPAAGHSLHGESFDDGPRHHAEAMPGMGKISFTVSTSKPEAQEFINQGVAQLHSFFYAPANTDIDTNANTNTDRRFTGNVPR
jgi:hypothetical protein